MDERIFRVIFDEDEVTWQSIMYDFINSGEIDPYDVDVSVLTRRYIDMIKQLKEHDFRVSGKVLLAAALLLKIKSARLVGEDIINFDRLLEEPEEVDLFGEEIPLPKKGEKMDAGELIPRTPQPRKRKVSIYDLMKALDKALEVKRRRVLQSMPSPVIPPAKTRDLTMLIRNIYGHITMLFNSGAKKEVMFSELIPSEDKEDKIYTFMPLLHLTNQRKIKLSQKTHFSDFAVHLRNKAELDKELTEIKG